MRWLWQFITLRAAFNVEIPRDAADVTRDFAARVRPRALAWSILLPPAGEYLAGEVSGRNFAVGCIGCAYVGGKCHLRWVVASGKFEDSAYGTVAMVVVRHGLDKVFMNFLLLTLSIVTLVGWPLLARQGGLGSVLAAGCNGLALVLPILWLFCNIWWWKEVQAGRKQLVHELANCTEG